MNPEPEKELLPILSFIDGRTLVHIEMHEGDPKAPTVTPLFSIPKKHIQFAELLIAAWNTRPFPPTGWRSMEDAPRDGTEILVLNGRFTVHARWGGSFHPTWVAVGHLEFCDHVSHWQPLPPPPSRPTDGAPATE